MPLSRHVETKTQSPSSDVGYVPFVSSCLSCGGGVSFLASSLVSPFGPSLLACIVCPSGLIVLSAYHLTRSPPARLIRSPRVPLLASSVRLSHRLIVSPLTSYRLAPRIIDKRGGEKMRSSSAGGHRRRMADGGRCRRGCLLASDGVGSDGVAVGAGPSCLLVMGAMGGAGGHLSSPSPRLIPSAMPPPGHPIDLASGHPIDGEGASFPFRPTPSRLLFSACLP